MRRVGIVFSVVAVCGTFACAPGGAASSLVKTPTWEGGGLAKCTVTKSQSEPLIVEWPSPDRARLEALAREGLVAVRYTGCEMKVLGSCRVNSGRYQYTGTTVKHDRETIQNADDLFAKLPLGAARLEGTLQRSGRLTVGMTIVGRYRADRLTVSARELQGDCHGATHFVAALTTGAFEFAAGSDASVGASASAFGGETGANSTAARSVLSSDGLESACSSATVGDTAPPAGCSALLRIEVVPFPELAEAERNKELAEQDRQREERESTASRRKLGWWLSAGGAVSLLGAGALAFAHYDRERTIESGGFATGREIESAQSASSAFNAGAIILGIVGVGLTAVGVPFILGNPEPAPAGQAQSTIASPSWAVRFQ